MSKELLTFHGKTQTKYDYLARIKAHQAADEIIQGKYWHEGKGCSIGCTIHSASHIAYETELGIPHLFARAKDVLHESMPLEKAKLWPYKFIHAIPVGVNLQKTLLLFYLEMLDGATKYSLHFLSKPKVLREFIMALRDHIKLLIENKATEASATKIEHTHINARVSTSDQLYTYILRATTAIKQLLNNPSHAYLLTEAVKANAKAYYVLNELELPVLSLVTTQNYSEYSLPIVRKLIELLKTAKK